MHLRIKRRNVAYIKQMIQLLKYLFFLYSRTDEDTENLITQNIEEYVLVHVHSKINALLVEYQDKVFFPRKLSHKQLYEIKHKLYKPFESLFFFQVELVQVRKWNENDRSALKWEKLRFDAIKRKKL